MSDITVYFSQHGLAVGKADDPARPLSDTGKEQTNQIAHVLHNNAIPVSQIFHSGKLRAAQTAEIFATVLQIDATTSANYLSPNDDVKQTAQQLVVANALYVGHLPHLEKLIHYLVCGDAGSVEGSDVNDNSTVVKFSNSAVACLQISGKTATLRWFLTADLTTSKN